MGETAKLCEGENEKSETPNQQPYATFDSHDDTGSKDGSHNQPNQNSEDKTHKGRIVVIASALSSTHSDG